MKRILVAVMLTIALTAMAAPPCWACSCVPMTKREQAKNADVIFTGKAKKVAPAAQEGVLRVRFRVQKVYKGNPKAITYVFTSSSGAACGVHFKEGTRYTVFADRTDSRKWVYSCSGTKRGDINPLNYGLGPSYPPRDQ